MNFDLSRPDLETLLAGFLTGTQAVEVGVRRIDLADLPPACRAHVRLAEASGRAWTAWSTPCGPRAELTGENPISKQPSIARAAG
jgi:hypothetical protein